MMYKQYDGNKLFDNSRGLTKQKLQVIAVAALFFIYIMLFLYARNQSHLNSIIVFVEDEGTFTGDSKAYHMQLNETYEVELNLTIYYNKVDNRTQLTSQLFKWNNTRYNSWEEGLQRPVESDIMIIEMIPPHNATQINQHITILTYTLTPGAWSLQIIPYYPNEYKIQLTTIP